MLTSYATGAIAMVVMVVAWVGIQLAWRRVFPGDREDPDALAGRMGCHGCTCDDGKGTQQQCKSKTKENISLVTEELS